MDSKKISNQIEIILIGNAKGVNPGKPTIESALKTISYIDEAVELAITGNVSGIVTGPVSKFQVIKAGINFTGHTEYIAKKCKAKDYCMMFIAESLRCSLVTTHIPLEKVPKAITSKRISTVIKLTNHALKNYFNIEKPRIGVTGLNPHAGEEGLLGEEEVSIIKPAIKAAEKIDCKGPFAADTIFRRQLKGEFDAIVAMYHDQALGAIKTLSNAATNVTLGLPFPRTSPDHGTAFDIAGKGIADPYPMINAINLCAFLAKKKN